MDDEIHVIGKNEMWKSTNVPTDKRSIEVTWVYKTKYNPNGNIDRFRLVYVEQPKGYVARGKEDKVYRLKKALYELKFMEESRVYHLQEKQPIVALSTAKAEHIAKTNCAM
ncbi:hypothetical protein CR513_31060, partial [Mucuna pruriens]